jgi:hypothetical protein
VMKVILMNVILMNTILMNAIWLYDMLAPCQCSSECPIAACQDRVEIADCAKRTSLFRYGN